MKILHIRFCNLNSLGGSWFIDLTSPEYRSDGIFAITGPTGAGKSTILDAVCLALYGRTPRLKQVSKSTNEIMTRQTGECWSEVEFSTSKGRYRCHWSQHRARKIAEGELQPPRHEIVNCANGQPLETKIKMVAQKVVDVTGMNYDQFTRSILLAQGDFNTFLKANPDERAPILEQITGTEVYSRISRKVHERKSEELLCLEQLHTECNGFTPLSDEQLTEIMARLEKLATEATGSEKNIAYYRTLLEWHTALEKLQQDIKLRTEQIAAQVIHWESMEPQRRQLARADKVKLLEPDYSRLNEQRALQEKETGEHIYSVSLLQKLTEDLQNTTIAEIQAKERLLNLKAEAKTQEDTLRQVRNLDQQVKNLTEQKTELDNELSIDSQRKIELEQSCIEISKKIPTIEAELKELANYRENNPEDKRLIEEFSGIHQQLCHYIALNEKHSTITAQIPALQETISRGDKQVLLTTQQSVTLTARQQQLEHEESQLKKQLTELLDNRTSEQLYTRASLLQEQLYQLNQATRLAAQLSKTEADLTALIGQERTISNDLRRVQESIQQATEAYRLRKDAADKQQQIVLLAARIHDFEQQRAMLQDGQPCPLCGSLSHPFSSTSGPVMAKEQLQLETDLAHMESAREKLVNLQATLAAAQEKREHFANRRSDKEKDRQETVAALKELCGKIGVQPDEHLPKDLSQLISTLVREQELLLVTRTDADNLKMHLEKIDSTKIDLARIAATTDQELQKQLHNQEKLHVQLQQLNTERMQRKKELDQKHHQLNQLLSPYAVQFTAADCGPVIERLEKKRATWLKSEERHQKLSSLLQETRAVQVNQQQLLDQQLKICNEKLARLARLVAAIKAVAQERHKLFADNNPDIIEKQMQARLEKEDLDLNQLQKQLGSLQQKYAALLERVHTLQQRITERTLQLQELLSTFTTGCTEAGLRDEKDFLDSRLDAQQYSKISQTIQQQQKIMDETKAVLDSSTISLAEEKRKKLTEVSPADINTLLTEQQALYSALQQETGALNQQVHDNERQRTLHAEQLKKLSAQKIELERWSRLHELIGSNDGKKFRNFAQGLTFEVMIQHANTSLQKMSDRYLLVRDPGQPLELHVIDNYQGGEMRSTKNLSGGESFIVSMALALGLSSMASNNVQVDSLFLDEGFGTLDEESLQTALDTLAGLHQDGKIIGIISHVSGLQERISTQIKVSPGLGGLSTLSGPGTGRWTGTAAE